MSILWIASYPKSGNTWTRIFLANYFVNANKPVNINSIANFMYGESRGDLYTAALNRPFAELTEEEVNRHRPDVQRYIAKLKTETLFSKTHHAIAAVAGVPTIAPDVTAGAIYCVRNPLDVCVSFAYHNGLTIDAAIESMASLETRTATTPTFAFNYLSSWSRHVLSWVDAPGLTRHVMRYEDMVQNTAATFSNLVKFLKIPLDTGRLDRALTFSSFEALQRQEEKIGFVERSAAAEGPFFRKGQIGDWRNHLSTDQVARLIADHHEVMHRFGYLTDENQPVF